MVAGAAGVKASWWLGFGFYSLSSAVVVGTRPQACVLGLCCTSPGVCVVFIRAAVMPRLRQRMLSHRGSARGAPSRPSSADAASSQEPRSRSRRGGILRPSQILEPSSLGSSTSPSFGSAIFTFNCSLNRPRITAHISILFLEEAQEEGDPSAPMPITEDAHEEGEPSAPMLIAGLQQEMEPPASIANVNPMVPVPPVTRENEATQAQDLAEGGWCMIVEEIPDV